MVNSRDSVCDYDPNEAKVYEVPYYVGEVLENKNNSNLLAKISEIRINRDGMKFVLGFDQTTYDFLDVEIVTKEELIEKWQKPAPTKIILWGKISKSSTNSGLAEIMNEMCDHFELTEKGIQLVKRK